MKAIKLIDINVIKELGGVRDGEYASIQILTEKINELIKSHNDQIADKQKASAKCL